MINLEDGSRLSGDSAPMKKDLDVWLVQHPGYVIDSIDDELEEGEIVSSILYIDNEWVFYQRKQLLSCSFCLPF